MSPAFFDLALSAAQLLIGTAMLFATLRLLRGKRARAEGDEQREL